MLSAMLLLVGFQDGPISKFDRKPPAAEFVSDRDAGDIERCLIDMPGTPAPNVYRQPDRPNEVTIVWLTNGTFNGSAMGRADLTRLPRGTKVKLWIGGKSVRTCTGES